MGSGLSQTAQSDPIYKEALTKISEAFDSYDKNKDGILSKREFLAIVNEHMPTSTSSSPMTVSFDDKESWFASLDTNGDGVIDRAEFMQWWAGGEEQQQRQRRSSSGTKNTKGLDLVRTNMANKCGIFLGFTYSEFKKSKLLDPVHIRQWQAKDVMLYLASQPELNVLRSELDREIWKDIDGETFLELEAEDLVEKKIKKYHIKKIMRIIESLRVADGTEQTLRQTPVRTNSTASTVGAGVGGASPRNSSSNLRTRTASLQQEPFASAMPSPRKIRRAGSNMSDASSGGHHFDWKKSDLLGHGAFGKVYLGLDNESGALLAVKEISFTRENAADVEELKLEISLLRTLDHNHIVRYLGAEVPTSENNGGSSELTLHIFTEYMPGGSILSLIKKFGALSESVVRNYT